MSNRFIEKLRKLAELGEPELRALERVTAHPKTIRSRKDLIREGDPPGPVLVVLEGWAFRYKVLPSGTRQIMAFLMPGDACDLHANMLAEMDHSIQTVTEASIATINRADMNEMMTSYPRIACAMYVAQLIDEGTLRAWIVSLGRRSSVERVAHLILELFLRAVRIELSDGTTMELPLPQAVLADALGMTPVHINRILQELRRSGAIELSRGVLRIKDPAALTHISGFDANYLHKRLK
ncbi:CRP-like cAMP-binding protein [Sphingomonas insulae]|uniref:Crp/Fnr family transcriptional regulator n=1 Tax=Sphingomonas insulae TaxID=424800 RepID=A0ABN1HZD0_9SPHN|nr:Crp/Fnr family transcriptional regulator [Sphingomonas insulae]NIJ31072.1 CRP-like cAMP-binding protein [Sphingomonas insulae]